MPKPKYVGIALLALTACNNIEKVSDNESQDEIKSIKEQIISDVIDEYQITYMWDTLDLEYSINYDKIINSDYQLIADLDIHDIFKKDDSYFISTKINYWPSHYFELSIQKKELDKILNILDANLQRCDGGKNFRNKKNRTNDKRRY